MTAVIYRATIGRITTFTGGPSPLGAGLPRMP